MLKCVFYVHAYVVCRRLLLLSCAGGVSFVDALLARGVHVRPSCDAPVVAVPLAGLPIRMDV